MALSGTLADDLDRPCPFGGRLTVTGPAFAGNYRILVREQGAAIAVPLTKTIWLTDQFGFSTPHAPLNADGWFPYVPWQQNTFGVLGYFDSSGDTVHEVILETSGGGVVDSHLVQLDNTGPTVSVSITQPGGDCGLFDPNVHLVGNVVATDEYMDSWSVVIDGGPAGFGPEATATTAITTQNTPAFGAVWEYQANGLDQCGYVVRVGARDRAIVGNNNQGHYRTTDVGFCILDEV